MSDSFNSNNTSNNLFSPIPKKQTIFNTYNTNKFKSIDSVSNRPLNRPLKNNSEFDIPNSSISSYNFQVNTDLISKYNKNNFQNDNNSNINYLRNKLYDVFKTNRELNKEYLKISSKSKKLINDININNSILTKIKNDYENELKINNELKKKCKNFIKNNKSEMINKEENDLDEIDNLKKEQKILLLTLKSKEDIINNLQKTLNILKNEIGDNKDNILNNTYENDILKNYLNEFNNKFEDNKKQLFLNNVNDDLKESLDIQNDIVKTISDKNNSIIINEKYENNFDSLKKIKNQTINIDNRNQNKYKSKERLNEINNKYFGQSLDISNFSLNKSEKKI